MRRGGARRRYLNPDDVAVTCGGWGHADLRAYGRLQGRLPAVRGLNVRVAAAEELKSMVTRTLGRLV
jgi:hypothetical protein